MKSLHYVHGADRCAGKCPYDTSPAPPQDRAVLSEIEIAVAHILRYAK